MSNELLEQLVREIVELRARVASLERVEERVGMRVIKWGISWGTATTLTTTYQSVITVSINNIPDNTKILVLTSAQFECTAYTGDTYAGSVIITEGAWRRENIERIIKEWELREVSGFWMGNISAGNKTIGLSVRKWHDINTIGCSGSTQLIWLLLK